MRAYTLVYNSRGLTLRTHQPFESAEKAIREDEDIASRSEYIYTAPQRVLVRDTDEGVEKRVLIADLEQLLAAYRAGLSAGNSCDRYRQTVCTNLYNKKPRQSVACSAGA